MYKVFYQNADANYPEFTTEEEALNFYVKEVSGETREEILNEEWTSPTGVKKCVEVRRID